MGDISALEARITNLEESLKEIIGVIQDTMDSDVKLFDKQKEFVMDLQRIKLEVSNYRFEMNDPRRVSHIYPRFYSFDDTISRICDEGASLARFGDGEFSTMQLIERYDFQRVDEELASRLKEVITSDYDGLLIGIADNFGMLEKYKPDIRGGIRRYMTEEVRSFLDTIVRQDKVYVNAYMTRFYSHYNDNMEEEGPKRRLNALKRIWDNRDVIMIEGAYTRLGVGNDLFDNTSSIRRILAPIHNVFDRYQDILSEAINNVKNGDLFIIATGPAAGVFVYDLFMKGFQAIDVGHLDIEYEYYLQGYGVRCPVPGKYNGELIGGDQVEEIHDPLYESQIISDCSGM